MAGESLAPYYATSPRYSPSLGGRDGVQGQVDALMNELQIPCTLDQDGGWRFQSDVGAFILLVHRDNGDLVLVQPIETMERRPRNYADAMHRLLGLNFEAEGARFASVNDNGKDHLVLTSRLHPDEVDAERFERMLEQAMRLSRRFDELSGAAAAQQAAAGQPPQAQYGPADAIPGPQGAPVAAQPPGPPLAAPEQDPAQYPATDQPVAAPQAAPVQQADPGATPPPDWYPDPHGQASLRYWDGYAWTEYTA